MVLNGIEVERDALFDSSNLEDTCNEEEDNEDE
jgi:hypothetical protein